MPDVFISVIVTGTRLVREDFEAISPVATIGARQVELTATLTAESLLNELPQVVPSNTRTSNSAGGEEVRTHEPSTALLTTGVYGVARNPIYVGFFLILVGIVLAAVWRGPARGALSGRQVRRGLRPSYTARVRRYGLF